MNKELYWISLITLFTDHVGRAKDLTAPPRIILLLQSLAHLSRHPSSCVNAEPYAHYWEDNSERFLDLSQRPITWIKPSNSHLAEWKLLLSPCVQGLLVSGCRLMVNEYCTLCPYISGNSDHTIISFVGCSHYIWNLKIPGAPHWSSLEWTSVVSYNGRQGIEM
jgi:hypothetical protein